MKRSSYGAAPLHPILLFLHQVQTLRLTQKASGNPPSTLKIWPVVLLNELLESK
jgi:hypothetical protein